MKRLLLLSLTLVVLLPAKWLSAAEKLDFATVDLLTYRYYRDKKWDSVIVIGKQALRQDIDYYYLRVRMGIAYFEKTEYFPAATHLQKARKFNSSDSFVADYLYRAYLYTNRNDEARLLRASMPEADRDTSSLSQGFVEQVHAETGYTVSSDRAPGNLATLMGDDSIYGQQDLYGNNLYANLSLKMRLSNRLGLSLAYNYLNFAKTTYIQYGNPEAQLDSISDRQFSRDYFYSFPFKIHDTAFNYHVSQHEAFAAATVTLPHGFKIIPSVHWLNVAYNMVSPAYHTDSISDTAYYSKIDSTWHMFKYPAVVYTFDRKDTAFSNWVISLRISKNIGRMNLALTGSWSNLNGKKQKQAGLCLTYYPFGSLNYYGTTLVTGFFQGKDKRLLLGQVVGAKITPWMWAEGNFYYGDFTNANLFNGAVVYNNSDIIDYRAGATLVFPAGKHLQFSLIYSWFRKESQQLYYIKTQDPVTYEINEELQVKTNPYNTNTLIGGITWKL
jgi:hypothetical protein